MEKDRSAAERWHEVEAFAFAPEFIRFCLAQATFVAQGLDEAFTRDSARHLGISARRRRLTVTDILLAKSIAGCKRSHSLDDHAHWSRYHRCLHWVLIAYHDAADALPSERLIDAAATPPRENELH